MTTAHARTSLVAEPWWTNSFMVTFAFRCNIACTFCMVEDVLNRFEGTSLETFKRFAENPAALNGAKRIIFSGGEVTLDKSLVEYVAIARSLPGIEHVRLQTNAIRLGTKAQLKALMAAGVDEFFVSFHAPDARRYDAISQHKGSFEAITRGMANIREAGATLITNTAIVQSNFEDLAEIVEVASAFGPRSMEFWNYWPRGDEEGLRNHAARVGDVQGPLLKALEAAVAREIPPVVKWFPRCLLGGYAWAQDDGQPPALIDDTYWQREPDYACLYEGVCSLSMGRPPDRSNSERKCAGLSDTYVHRYGWEEHLLQPVRLTQAPHPSGAERPPVARSLVKDSGPKRAAQAQLASWLAALQLTPGLMLDGFQLMRIDRPKPQVLALSFVAANGATVVVGMTNIDASRRVPLRTRSFDVFYKTVVPALAARAMSLLRAVGEHLALHDEGGLAVPLAPLASRERWAAAPWSPARALPRGDSLKQVTKFSRFEIS